MFEGTSLTFDADKAEEIRTSAEFREVNNDSDRNAVSAKNPYELANVHVAHAYGLTGKGVKLGIVDSGFNLRGAQPSHMEYDSHGKVISLTTAPPNESDSHGSHVAGLAAGERDGKGMHGISPGATLVLGLSPQGANEIEAIWKEF